MEDRTRPLGITIIAAFLGISAILALLILILGLNRVSTLGLGEGMTASTSIALLGAIILGFFEVALAWGLWTLRPWAYWTTIIVEAIRVILGLYVVLILKRFTREEHVSVFPIQASRNLKTARCPMIFDIS